MVLLWMAKVGWDLTSGNSLKVNSNGNLPGSVLDGLTSPIGE